MIKVVEARSKLGELPQPIGLQCSAFLFPSKQGMDKRACGDTDTFTHPMRRGRKRQGKQNRGHVGTAPHSLRVYTG